MLVFSHQHPETFRGKWPKSEKEMYSWRLSIGRGSRLCATQRVLTERSETFAPQTRAETVWTLLGLGVGLFLAGLDQTVVATVGPLIQSELQFSAQRYVWMTTAYLLGSTVPVPLYGQLSTRWGRKAVFLFGLVLFVVASCWCGLAGSPWSLVAARAVQGVGSAALFTTAVTSVADLFAPQQRPKYVAWLSAVVAVSSVAGPLLGGFAADHGSWRWVFWVNLPLGAMSVLLCLWKMPNLRPPSGQRMPIDWLGVWWLSVSVIPLLLWASLGRNETQSGQFGFAWASFTSFFLLAGSSVAAVLYVRSTWQSENPLIDLKALASARAMVALVASFCLASLFLAPLVFLPLFMVYVRGVTHVASGLTVTPLVLGVVLGNVVSGQVVARFKVYRPMMIAALVVLVSAFTWLSVTLSVDGSTAEVTAQMLLLGFGFGPALPLYTLVVQESVKPSQVSMATATVTFVRQLGGTLGIALLGSLFASDLSMRLKNDVEDTVNSLPAEVSKRLGSSQWLQRGFEETEGATALRIDPEAYQATAARKLDAAAAVARRALAGEWLAGVAIQNSGLADEWLIRDSDKGGVRQQTLDRFEAQWPAVAEALQARQPLSVEPTLAKQLTEASDEAQAHALFQREAVKRADAALAQAEQRLNQQVAQTKAIAHSAIDDLAQRARASLAAALRTLLKWTATLSALVLLLTAFLPVRRLSLEVS